MDITKVLLLLQDITTLEMAQLDIKFDAAANRYERLAQEIQWWNRFMIYCHTGK